MNTIVTSREDILKKSKELALNGGFSGLSIRAVAKACGISIGSVYNYFETKNELIIAVVSEVWKEMFSMVPQRGSLNCPDSSSCPVSVEADFLCFVEYISEKIHYGIEAHPAFFREHSVLIDDKAKGREVMEEYFRSKKEELLALLMRDPKIRDHAWSNEFQPEAFVDFIFRYWKMALADGRMDTDFLKQLILRTIY